jgi:hypothetical protein
VDWTFQWAKRTFLPQLTIYKSHSCIWIWYPIYLSFYMIFLRIILRYHIDKLSIIHTILLIQPLFLKEIHFLVILFISMLRKALVYIYMHPSSYFSSCFDSHLLIKLQYQIILSSFFFLSFWYHYHFPNSSNMLNMLIYYFSSHLRS